MRHLLALICCLLGADLAAAERPNVLLIVSEDNGPELGCYGDPYARTPNLDRLASEGVRFERAFVTQAGCSQSRASFLTGLYPHQHGQIGLATWGFRMYREDTPNLPRNLKTTGYRTGIIGKLHVNPESAFPFDYRETPGANFGRRQLADYAKHAAGFIGASDRPFFLSVNFPDAHDPWIRQVDGLPKAPLTGKEVKAMPYVGVDPKGMREMVADYYNSIARLDACVGELLAALEKSGKAANTLVIYLGDHGADFLRGKRTCLEGGLRVPLILRWPGRATPQVRRELVSTVDLMPTVLGAAGAPAVAGLPGHALQPLLSPGEPKWRTHLFAEYHAHAAGADYFPQRSVRSDRFKLIENLLPGEIHPDYERTLTKLSKDSERRGGPSDLRDAIAGATEQVKNAYARMRGPPRYELYDLEEDPFEFHDLASRPEHAETLAGMVRELTGWRKATSDPLLAPSNLERLTEEVRGVDSKAEGKGLTWGYPDYFFGREPQAPTAAPTKKKKKSK
jgi:N-sulfoglucosamine sulfohydrolase